MPDGCEPALRIHEARVRIRALERTLYATNEPPFNATTRAFINRLSDYLFVAAHHANHLCDIEESTL